LGAAVVLVATLAFAGYRFLESRSSEKKAIDSFSPPLVPQWAKDAGFADDPKAVVGAQIFAQVGCMSCHTYLGTGSANLGAPDLSAIGRDSHRGADGFAAYVADPSKYGNNVMPRFKDLGRTHLLELGAFLEASKGRR
jgi:mono/diheme cytochrome c family protein